jgi:hypothetical protein
MNKFLQVIILLLLTGFFGHAQTVNLSVNASTGRESATSVITMTATASGAVTGDQTVALTVSGSGITSTDYVLSSSTITLLNGATTGTATFTVLNDTDLEGSEFVTLTISNPSPGITLGATTKVDLLIFDNDFPSAPAGNQDIKLSFVSSYLNVGPNPGNSAEISAYDTQSKRLFIANSLAKKLNIVDFSNPAAMTAVATIDVATYGGINSVAARNGIVAVAIEATNLTNNGSVVFFDKDGTFLNQVSVGAMPDMITFSPNGNLVLTANEGEPSDDYTIDPEGTVSIIDITTGAAAINQTNVTTVNFNSFDADLATLKSQGIRIYGANSPTVSKDFEPEYISFSTDGNTAYVTLQENNAIAVLDIATKAFTAIRPLGLKNHNTLTTGLDATDQGGVINITNLPVKGMYQPDAIATYTIGADTYLVTANEGDSRVYPRTGTATFNEEVRVSSGSYVLDPTVFPNATLLKNNGVLGRLQLSNKTGDTDNDGDFDEIHALGARSFSIWKAAPTSLSLIFDSGDQFERITAADPIYGSIFNASNSIGTPTLKDRSDNKGPEPEGVAIGTIEGKTYAFIALERTGGVMVYNVSNPAAPVFVQYINNRSTTAATGDLGAEGIFFIPAAESPNGSPLIVVSNEISSTVSVYSVALPRTVTLTTNAVTGTEAASSVITITATASGPVSGDQTVSIVVSGSGITGTDYVLSSSTITILNGQTTGTATLTIANDTDLEGSEIIRVALSTPSSNLLLGANILKDHMIFDNDFPAAPVGNAELQLSFVSSYLNVGANPGNSAEISAYDPASKRLYIANSLAKKLNIVDFSNPAAMSSIATIDVATYGGINSVAVNKGIVAVAIEAANLTDNGSVVFFDKDGVFLKQVAVGSMPDMITFSPNGNLVLTADEGEPSDDYSVDPEGTVSIVDISGGVANVTQSNVTKVNFNSFDAQLSTLKSQGVRIYGANNATVSKDLEPEYIAFSSDGNTAFITLQENNAIAVLDIASKAITAIRPLGLKDHNMIKNGLDATDQGGVVNIANLPVKGMYEPDAIAGFAINGVNYLVTANEGDSRVYPRTGTATFNEEVRVGSGSYVLDPTVFPNATLLKNNAVLGRLQLSNKSGDTDNDGDFDEIHALGSRSFSIWKPTATGLEQVFDSGDQLERITAADPTYGNIFNASNSIGVPTLKDRSDNKGPEPEGVTVATINGKVYAFIALERTGGVMVYNVTDPANPVFVQWSNNRTLTAPYGDLGSEGIFFISAANSPTGVPLVVLSNEVSSTISVYSISGGAGSLPAAPTALAVTSTEATVNLALNWTDNASNESGFEILRSINETSGFVALGTVLANVTTFADNTVSENTTYYYRVRAFNDFGYSSVSSASIKTKQSQTITFTAPANKTLGDAAFSLSATASSTLTVTYTTSSDKLTINGSQVTLSKAGRATIVANQSGNASFLPAPAVERSFCINPSKPTVVLSNLNTETVTLTSSSSVGNQWYFNGAAIAGATNASLNVNGIAAAGIYKVQVKVDDCISEFSEDVPLIVTGDIAKPTSSVSIYPNPAEEYLHILGMATELSELHLMDYTGRMIKIGVERSADGYRANVKELAAGVYFLHLNEGSTVQRIKFIKR